MAQGSYRLVSREFKPEPTVVNVGGVAVGGRDLVVMAGPCAVETREQLLESARAVKAAGAQMLRGGAFKPRTSPYSFQGHGEEGLQLLAEARAETGLPVVTEIMDPRDVELVSRYADVLQVGARNCQNYALLRELGQASKPVLLKRGMHVTAEELLQAAEYVAAGGNAQVVLAERGIRTFETATRNTLDLSAVPVLKERSHLPVLVDPTHGTGYARYVPAMARAAVAAGADALLIEVHPCPDEAWCDAEQALTPAQFAQLMDDLRRIAAVVRQPAAPPAAVGEVKLAAASIR